MKNFAFASIMAVLIGCAEPHLERTETRALAPQQATQDIAVTPAAGTVTEIKQPAVQKPETEEDAEALEPISIGGAFLVCLYPQNQKQGTDTYMLNCNVEASKNVSERVVSVEFYKVDSAGNQTSLMIQSQNLDTLTFVIKESAETFFQSSVQLILYAANGTSATMKTAVASMSVDRAAKFWLGGEPNNAVEAGIDEDCVEYQNMAAKQQNEATSGLTNGPLGRLNDNQCNTVQKFVCKSTKAKDAQMWVLSTYQGPFADYTKACPAGYQFALPMNDKEATALNALVDQINTPLRYWVALDDREVEGKFVIVKK